MIFRFVLKFLQPIASLVARVNIEGNVAVAGLRLFELLSRKADLSENWAAGEKKRTGIAIGELLTNYRRWSDGMWMLKTADLDTSVDMNEDEPFVDVCYISDMLVNMIASDSQHLGMDSMIELMAGDVTPWSFELFGFGLDIILPKMGTENFKVSIYR